MDSVAIRLKKACDIGGFSSREELSKKSGVPINTINDWAKNKKDKDGNIVPGNISRGGAKKIASVIQISKTYLETGEGDPYLNSSKDSDYSHPARKEEMIKAYEKLENEDKEHFYHLMRRMATLQNDEKIDYKF